MAARRSKSQARRKHSNGLPGWAWLVLGILVTLLVVLGAPRLLRSGGSGDGFFRPRPNPDAMPASVNEDGDPLAPDTEQDQPGASADGDTKPKPKPTQYDFYTLLPGEGVAMSDAELAASAKAEAAALKAASATDAADPATLPPPIADAPAKTDTATSNATPTAPGATASSPASEARYILQAGAFGASGDAEAVKAKIALLGLNARVESAQISDKTMYRVRMGPYGSASELAEAKAKLASGGLPAMAVRAK